MNDKLPKLLTRQEAAKALRISTRTLDRLQAAGKVKPSRVGKRVLFTADQLRHLLAA